MDSAKTKITKDSSKSIDMGGMPFLNFETEISTKSSNSTKEKGIGEFEVNVETLETEMGHRINLDM